MRPGRFANVLPLAGLSEASQIATGDHWQLWGATEEHAFGGTQVHVLYLDSRATWAMARQTIAEIQRHLPSRATYHAVVQNSAPIAMDLQRAQREFAAVSARTVRQLLGHAVVRMLGARRHEGEPELERLFVDPDVQVATTGVGAKTAKATETLLQWLTDDRGVGPRIAVLVAPAGVGKTTLATHLFQQLRVGGGINFPLLVQSDQWARLSDRTSLALWDVWRESLDVMYASTINRDDFDTCVENGVFVPIFDGFDELCTRLGSHFRPSDTLDQLEDLVAESDGRILLTTRDGFWADNIPAELRAKITHFHLQPFNKQQTAKYFENRFRTPTDFPKREVANKILVRLGQAAHRDDQPAFRERLTAVPLVVALVAECADSADAEPAVMKYGSLLDGNDPLEGLLLILFERERERRRLAISPEDQLALFTQVVIDLGGSFSRDDLRLYASVHAGVEEGSPQLEALQSHVILRRQNGQFSFRFDFLTAYITGRGLVEYLLTEPPDPRVIQVLAREARGGSDVIERAVERLFASHASDWVREFSRTWASLPRETSAQARSGLLHLILKAAERAEASGPRGSRSELVCHVLGQEMARLRDLYVEGTITGLDLRGFTWERTRFVNAGFAKCIFDSGTRFRRCRFDAGFELEDCTGFAEVVFEESDFGPRAREVIQAVVGTRERLPVTSEQIRATVRLALEKFQRGVGFKSLARSNCKRGRMARSPICDVVWEALERFGVVEAIRISGVPEGGVAVGEGRRGEVRNFLSNAILAGGLKEAVEWLERELGVR